MYEKQQLNLKSSYGFWRKILHNHRQMLLTSLLYSYVTLQIFISAVMDVLGSTNLDSRNNL